MDFSDITVLENLAAAKDAGATSMPLLDWGSSYVFNKEEKKGDQENEIVPPEEILLEQVVLFLINEATTERAWKPILVKDMVAELYPDKHPGNQWAVLTSFLMNLTRQGKVYIFAVAGDLHFQDRVYVVATEGFATTMQAAYLAGTVMVSEPAQ